MKNWLTLIPKGTVVVIPDVPLSIYERDKDAVNDYGDHIFKAEIIPDDAGPHPEIIPDKLREEKMQLLARVDEIDRILAEKA